jgi:hypothetical protein
MQYIVRMGRCSTLLKIFINSQEETVLVWHRHRLSHKNKQEKQYDCMPHVTTLFGSDSF